MEYLVLTFWALGMISLGIGLFTHTLRLVVTGTILQLGCAFAAIILTIG